MIRISLAALVLAVMSCGAFAAESCSVISGGGIGVTEDIARFMSNKALHDLQDKYGEKPASTAAKTTCTNKGIYIDCVSSQKSCKTGKG